MQIPDKFDKDLVYLTFCQYADNFVDSSKNYLNNDQIFDKIVLIQDIQRFTARRGFFYVDKFVKLVESLQESGIYKFWHKQAYEEYFGNFKAVNHVVVSPFDVVDFSRMAIPLALLVVGYIISFIVFTIEHVVYKWKESCLNRIGTIKTRVQELKIRKKVKLDKWMLKYIYKKNLRVTKTIKAQKDKQLPVTDRMLTMDNTRETVKSRESINGAYFKIKKFKKPVKQRYRHRIIQVKPYIEE
jgi:hypothetical protein